MPQVLSKSPEGLTFAPRRPTFKVGQALAGDWHGENAFRTAWFNALSMQFPIGEKFFIDSVRFFSDEIDDPKLAKEVRAFQGQESVHRLEHQRYNESLCAQRGYNLEHIEKRILDRLEWARRELSPRRQLAGTVAYEHITAILADDLLRHDDVLRDANSAIAELWRWHAVEETEHKSVAFDVYCAVGGRLRERRMALFMNSWFFFKDTFGIANYMLKVDGKNRSLRVWLSGLNFIFGKPGFLRRCIPQYFRFYGKRFHPWNHDNRQLIEAWSAGQGGAADPGAAT